MTKKYNRRKVLDGVLSTTTSDKVISTNGINWTTRVVSSALVIGLVSTSPAWGFKAVLCQDKPAAPHGLTPNLTTVLPPLPPRDTLNRLIEIAIPDQKEVLFIDLGVAGYKSLIESLSRNVEVVLLDPKKDGITTITAHLKGRNYLRGIHIVSHGGPGRLDLGNTTLTAEDITARNNDLVIWARALGPEGDILLYGCEVAKGMNGIRFVNRLAHTLTAGVSASDDPTGARALGGDWRLEYRKNSTTTSIFSASVTQNFHALLAPGNIIAGDGSGGGGGAGGDYAAKYSTYPAKYGGQGGAGGDGNDTLTGTTNDDIIFGDGSGGGGGSGGKTELGGYAGGYGGGAGGSGNDNLHGGAGDDILFGDGFDGQQNDYNGTGGDGGLGNINGGKGGSATGESQPSDGQAGFGGALGGLAGSDADKYYFAEVGQPGDEGSTANVSISDSGGTFHTSLLEKTPAYFDGLSGGSGDDTLDGGPGSDILLGMGGTNTFVFESDDASSGTDIDRIYDWSRGTNNHIELKTGGITLTRGQINTLLPYQFPLGDDRFLLHEDGSNSVAVVIYGIGRDLALGDFIVAPNTAPTFTATPMIIGAPKVGRMLALINTVTQDLDGDTVALSYQWYAEGVDIPSATSATYEVTSTELKQTITCTITANDGYGGVANYTTAGVKITPFPWQLLMPALSADSGED